MPKSDWELFNCSEKHELDYVVGLYKATEQDAVSTWIKARCTNGTINNWTHKKLYEALKDAGFTKVK